jgi:hypothetical protein
VEGRLRSRPDQSSRPGRTPRCVYRPLDDPNYVVGELEFETSAEADACHDALRKLWNSRQAAPALVGTPRVRIVETVDSQDY